MWITSYSVGAAIGPPLGGVLLQYFWRGSLLLVAVPVMVLLLALGPILLPEFRDPKAGRLDLASAAQSLAAVLAVIYGLEQIAEHGLGWLPALSIVAGLAVGNAPPERAGAASAISETGSEFGGALGICRDGCGHRGRGPAATRGLRGRAATGPGAGGGESMTHVSHELRRRRATEDRGRVDHTRRFAKGVEAMITGLAGASIWSEDLNNLLPFYRDVLGLAVSVQTPGFVVLGGLGLGTHSEVRGRNADPARHMVGLTTNDITADWKRFKDAGVEFVEDPTDYGNLTIATLRDPEGNLVQLFQSSGAA